MPFASRRPLASGTQLLLAALLTACGPPDLLPRAQAPSAPSSQAKCQVAASQSNPLVTEWPASEKANLEVQLQHGGVAVAYSGCEMRLVSTCRLGGRYTWLRTTSATDRIEINNEDELYAKLPLGAISLEGELRARGRLVMNTTVSGQMRLAELDPRQVPRSAACLEATHVVTALSIGAFKLKSGADLKGSAGLSVLDTAKAGVRTESSELLLREAGLPEQCSASTVEAPHFDCRSPIQMFLQPLPWTMAKQAPAGTISIEFLSGGDGVWEVVRSNEAICETPCTRFLRPSTHLLLRTRTDSLFNPRSEFMFDNLHEYAHGAPLQVRAKPTSRLLMATGIAFTSLSGIAMVTGIPLLAAGCSGTDTAMCRAGAITFGVGAAGLAPSIIGIVASKAHPEVRSANLALEFGPGYLRGDF